MCYTSSTGSRALAVTGTVPLAAVTETVIAATIVPRPGPGPRPQALGPGPGPGAPVTDMARASDAYSRLLEEAANLVFISVILLIERQMEHGQFSVASDLASRFDSVGFTGVSESS